MSYQNNQFIRGNVQARCERKNALEQLFAGKVKPHLLKELRMVRSVDDGTVGSGSNQGSAENHRMAKFSDDFVVNLYDEIIREYAEFEDKDTYDMGTDWKIIFHLKMAFGQVPKRVLRPLKVQNMFLKKVLDAKGLLILDFIDYKKIMIQQYGYLVYFDSKSSEYYFFDKESLMRSLASKDYKEIEGDDEKRAGKIKKKSKILIDSNYATYRCKTEQEVVNFVEGIIQYHYDVLYNEITLPLTMDTTILVPPSQKKVGKVQPYVLENGHKTTIQCETQYVVCKQLHKVNAHG